jgi:GntR family galactonate operon transcriptional repressor
MLKRGFMSDNNDAVKSPRRSRSSPAATNRSDFIAETIGRGIVGGRTPPGTILPPELELCASLGVSRAALREGFRLLTAKGMILGRRKLGTSVRPVADWNMIDASVLAWHLEQEPTEAYVNGLYEARQVIEPAAAAMAARRATSEEVARIAGAYHDMAAAQARAEARAPGEDEDQDETSRTVAADLRFHQEILAATGNYFLSSFVALIGSSLTAAFRLNWRAHSTAPQLSLGRHEAVLEAIRLRSEEGARAAMQALLDAAATDARQALLNARPPAPRS